MKRSSKLNAAFTLIQLLILIAVLSALTTYTISSNQESAATTKKRQAAVEIQRYLEASIQYYKTHAKWPTTMSDLTDDKLIPIIPASQGSNLNPWAKPYNLIPLNGERGDDFEITTELPTQQYGEELKHYLPNTTVQGTILHTQITTENKSDDLIFVGAESNVTSKTLNACPSGQSGCLSPSRQQHYEKLCQEKYGRKADFEVALQSFDAGEVPVLSDLARLAKGRFNYDFYDLKIVKNTGNNRWGFKLTLDRQEDPSLAHEGEAVMFIYCLPAKASRN